MMSFNIKKYQTLLFDCDGVILNSNRIKTNAFFKAALPYGEPAAKAIVDYHVAHGGISRYEKFQLFLKEIVPNFATEKEGPDLDSLLRTYANEVKNGLKECEVSPGLIRLKEKLNHTSWLIVSGGDEQELRELFKYRELDWLFDGGIFGSPKTKDEIITQLKNQEKLQSPILFLGDSRYDYDAAKRANIDFAYISGWSEWQPNAALKKEFVACANNIQSLI